MDYQLAGHEAAHVARKIDRRSHEVLRICRPLEASRRRLNLLEGHEGRQCLVPVDAFASRGMGKSRRYGVDVNVVYAEFLGHTPREGHHRSLGGDIVRHAGNALEDGG